MKVEVNYSPELDILTADRTEQEYEKSVNAGDFIIDLNPKGEVRGLEIQNVSKITGADREQLDKINNAEIKTRKTEGNIIITLRATIEEQKTTLAAQIQDNQIEA